MDVPNSRSLFAARSRKAWTRRTWWSCAATVIQLAAAVASATAAPPAPKVAGVWPEDTFPVVFLAGMDPSSDFNDFGWRLFLAAVWPGDDANKGEPDPAATLGGVKPPAIEGWAGIDDLYQDGGGRPPVWADAGLRKPPLPAFVDAPPARVLSQLNQMGLGVPYGPLVAQNGTYTLYETRVNRKLYEFLRGTDVQPSSWRYLAKNLPARDKPALDYPTGSICFKAAWRLFQLPAEEQLLKRYHTMTAWVPIARSPFWERQTVGLTGFHLIVRTDRRPEWLWFSFEHVDNLVVGPDAPPGTKPTYNNPTGPQLVFHPDVNRLPDAVFASGPPRISPTPVPAQVVRFSRIPSETKLVNNAYQSHASVSPTVWRHYSLIVAQWPLRRLTGGMIPGAPGFVFPDAFSAASHPIANSVLETTTHLQVSESCMKCHGARKSFATGPLWFVATRAR